MLELKNVECCFDHKVIIKHLDLQIQPGQIACLLGPSGCGKTTLLRTIAGFEPLCDGEVYLRGKLVAKRNWQLAPEKRNIGMVFQDYALFPHMTVMDNICFGIQHLARAQRCRRAIELLQQMSIADLANSYPHQLSGGQKQRVALARTLAPQPDFILLDEPFSNLDIELRERLSMDVRNILKAQGITALLVTHDQHEAFAMCDVIGVLNDGNLQQWSSAYDLYHEPDNYFVADFVGDGVFLPGKIINDAKVVTEIGTFENKQASRFALQSSVDVLLRPDDITPNDDSKLRGKVVNKAFRGAGTLYTLSLPSERKILALFPSHNDYALGETIGFTTNIDHLVLFKHH